MPIVMKSMVVPTCSVAELRLQVCRWVEEPCRRRKVAVPEPRGLGLQASVSRTGTSLSNLSMYLIALIQILSGKPPLHPS